MDPRHPRHQGNQGLQDRLFQATVNAANATKIDLGWKYSFGHSANLQEAATDHSYLKEPFTAYWVDRGNSVTAVKVRSIKKKKTRSQSRSYTWFIERSWRLMASRFGSIVKMTERRDVAKFCEELFNPKSLKAKAVLQGRDNECTALTLAEKKLGVNIDQAGLFINPEWPYLAATPDRVIRGAVNGVVKVKCPYGGRQSAIKAEFKDYFPFLVFGAEGKKNIKRTHDYFYQITGQMAISKAHIRYFVVYAKVDLFIEKIEFDQHFFETNMLPKLSEFYKDHYRNFIASKL